MASIVAPHHARKGFEAASLCGAAGENAERGTPLAMSALGPFAAVKAVPLHVGSEGRPEVRSRALD